MSCCLYWVIHEERLSVRVLASAVEYTSVVKMQEGFTLLYASFNPDEKCLQRGTDWVFK